MKKRVLNFVLILGLVAVLGFWIFSNIQNEFLSLAKTQQLRLVSAIVDAFPDALTGQDARGPKARTDILEWLEKSVKNGGGKAAFVLGVPMPGESFEAIGDGSLIEIFAPQSPFSSESIKGFDNVAYDETYRSAKDLKLGNTYYALFFAPVAQNGEVIGALVAALDISEENSFINLLILMFCLAFAILALVTWQVSFSRDVITGFAVLTLFIIAAVFVAYPLLESLRLSFYQDGVWTLDIWKTILTSRGYRSALSGSIELGVWTATCSTILGFVFAFVCSRTNIPCKGFITAMGTLPVISPPFSLTLSIILLFGNNGLFTRMGLMPFSIYGLPGLVLAQTIGMFPVAFLTLSGVLAAIDSTFEDAALNLSATRMKVFSSITLPLALPGFLSAWLLVFTISLADFANPLILAGNFRVLSLESYMEVTGMNRLGHGAALSMVLLVPTLTAFLVQRFWIARKSYVTVTGKPSGRITDLTTRPVKIVLVGVIALTIIFLISLYGTIIAGCFVKNWGIDYTFSLDNIFEAVTRGKDALFDTLALSLAATPIAGVLAMVSALLFVRKTFYGKRLLEILMMTPFALPGTLVGISYVLAFSKAPLILVGTAAIIVVNYTIRELPVGIEGGMAALRQIDPSIEEAATDLGADSAVVFRTIVLPLVRPAFLSGLSYTFVRSMTAVSAVIFLISARWYHLTILIYNFSENLRFGLASVLSTVLIIIVFGVFGLMRLLVRRNDNLTKTIGA